MRGEGEAVGSAARVRMQPGDPGRPFRMFATWIADEGGPMFCRWTEPSSPTTECRGRPDAELRD